MTWARVESADELEDGLSEDLRKQIADEGFYDVVSEDGELGLESASPCFDSDYQSRIWGVCVLSKYWGAIELPDDLAAQLLTAKEKFKSKTGLDGRAYIGANVT